ncbi:MAG: hypothetical protein KDK70_20965 [Myxococcales bacterium]|nr:hypothetical protein [Myxococcales bacterium]
MTLRISPDQLAALRMHWATPEVEALFDHVEAQLGVSRPIQPEHGQRLISEALGTARRHGLADPDALRRYAVLVIRVGDDLGHEPAATWSGPILDDPWLSDDEKVGLLEQAAADHGLPTR